MAWRGSCFSTARVRCSRDGGSSTATDTPSATTRSLARVRCAESAGGTRVHLHGPERERHIGVVPPGAHDVGAIAWTGHRVRLLGRWARGTDGRVALLPVRLVVVPVGHKHVLGEPARGGRLLRLNVLVA